MTVGELMPLGFCTLAGTQSESPWVQGTVAVAALAIMAKLAIDAIRAASERRSNKGRSPPYEDFGRQIALLFEQVGNLRERISRMEGAQNRNAGVPPGMR